MDNKKTSSFVNYEQASPSSGWEVLFFEDKSLPYIRYSLFFPFGGSGFNSPVKSGLGKFTLSLLDQGAGKWTSEEIQEKLNFYGTEMDTRTGRETAKVVLSGLSLHSEALWEIFHTVITQPHFQVEEIKDLKEKIIQGRLQSLDDKGRTAYEVWLGTLFPEKSLSSPVSGTIPSIKSLSRKDIQDFYNTYILGTSKILAVTGNFKDSLKRKILSSLKGTKKNKKQFSPLSLDLKGFSSSPNFYFLTKSDLTQSEVLIGFSLPPFPKKNFKEYLAFSLGNNVFGGRGASRLMNELREERGLTYGIYSARVSEREYGFFMIDGNTKTKTTVEFLEGILSLLKDLKEKGIKEEELVRAKVKKKNEFLSQIEMVERRADNFIYYKYGLNVQADFLSDYLNSLEKITLKEVNQALKRNIHLDRLHILVYGHPDIREDLNKLKTITKTLSFEERFAEELQEKQKGEKRL